MRQSDATDLSSSSDALVPSLRAGALGGVVGLLYGGVEGVLRGRRPVIRSISSGIHWGAIGASFWWLRSNVLQLHYEGNASPQERAYTSALSGGVTGGLVTRLMGGRLVPAAVIFSLLGYVGQVSYNILDRRQLERINTPSKPLIQRLADSKWVPLKPLSDEDYRRLLNEKLLSIEAEIALIDEKIEELQKPRASSPEANSPETQ